MSAPKKRKRRPPARPRRRPDDWRLEQGPRWPELRAAAMALAPDLPEDAIDFVGRWRGLLVDAEPDAQLVADVARAVHRRRQGSAAAGAVNFA